MALSTCDHGCQTAPDAEHQKAFSALLMSPEPGALCDKKNDPSCELDERAFYSVHGAVKELLCPQDGSAAGLTLLPRAREATCNKQEDSSAENAVNEDVEKRFCSSHWSLKGPLDPWARSTTWDKQESAPGGSLAPIEWIRSHPKITLVVLALLLLLLLALVVALAVVSGRTQTENPIIPDTPRLLACPHGWVGHRGICYFLSRDQLSWDQAQARCSELGASLAVLQDWEMEFLFCLTRNEDHWLGLRRRGRELQWGDGSSFNSSVPVLGNAGCVFLAEDMLRSAPCSNPMPFVCSRAQTHR